MIARLVLEDLTQHTGAIAGALWQSPLTLALLLGTGVWLTVRLGAVQLRCFGHAIAIVRGRYRGGGEAGEVSPLQALATVLSATVGTGNIAGVATAVSLGGPGALFWMWMTAAVGMATKFTECTLAVRFRDIDDNGEVAGGPMYTLSRGLGQHWLGVAFAVFAMVASFGIGNMVQANSVVDGLAHLWPGMRQHAALAGIAMASLVGLVIIGGVRRIARVASALVPAMAAVYLGGALVVVVRHLADVPAALAHIVRLALDPAAAGAAALGEAMRWGVARGLFSNEAGLGSSPMAFAATRTSEPVRAGLVAMLGPFVDTIVICTMTGLVIVLTGALDTRPAGAEGAALTAYAFDLGLGGAGGWVVGLGLALFAFSTTIAWSYYGDRCARFLFGRRAVLPYRLAYVVLFAVGAAVPLRLVWNIADITNLLMALPNLVAVIALSGLARQMLLRYRATLGEPQ